MILAFKLEFWEEKNTFLANCIQMLKPKFVGRLTRSKAACQSNLLTIFASVPFQSKFGRIWCQVLNFFQKQIGKTRIGCKIVKLRKGSVLLKMATINRVYPVVVMMIDTDDTDERRSAGGEEE